MCFVAMGSGMAMAQEDQPSNMAKTQPALKQDSWETWKQDVKAKYQSLRDQADKIKSDAQTKKVTDPDFKAAVDKFEAAAKTFTDKWSTVDQVTPDKRDQFKADLTVAWNNLKSAFDVLKSESSGSEK
jgi:hypothetical protein